MALPHFLLYDDCVDSKNNAIDLDSFKEQGNIQNHFTTTTSFIYLDIYLDQLKVISYILHVNLLQHQT